VSVNVSARQLQTSAFVDEVRMALDCAELEPEALVLEITEAAVVHDPASAAEMLAALRAMGVGLVLDDFGTGYSSLAMLDALPFDGMKLDRTSVMRIGDSGGAVPLVKAIVDLGRALGLSLVAEGFENEHQLAELRRLGVREGQGFRFARPLPAAGFEELLREGVSGHGPERPGTGGRRPHGREQLPRGARPVERPRSSAL
jgi:EAL domain-containing protein (putative c-di-GMP-specific phosphodiesterase class I)